METMNAVSCSFVMERHCVMFDAISGRLAYAGPIERSPKSEGKTVYMHPNDFELLERVRKLGLH